MLEQSLTQKPNLKRNLSIMIKKKKIKPAELPEDFYDLSEVDQLVFVRSYKKKKKEKKAGLDWQNVFKRVWLPEDKRQETLSRLEVKNPKEEQVLKLLFSLKDFFYSQNLLDRSRRSKYNDFEQEEIKKEVLTCTTWYYQASKFLIENKADKNKIQDFWLKIEQIINTNIEISDLEKKKEMFESLRQAVASQVASYYIFQELNKSVELSSPEDDAFRESDLQITDLVDDLSGKGLKATVRYILSLQVKRVKGSSFSSVLVETASLTSEMINTNFPTEAVDYFIGLTSPGKKTSILS